MKFTKYTTPPFVYIYISVYIHVYKDVYVYIVRYISLHHIYDIHNPSVCMAGELRSEVHRIGRDGRDHRRVPVRAARIMYIMNILYE